MSELETRIREIIREEIAIALAAWKPEPAEGFLDTKAAAAYASVSIGTIRRWVRERRLPEHRAGRRVRLKRSELDALIAGPRRRRRHGLEERNRRLSPEEKALRDVG